MGQFAGELVCIPSGTFYMGDLNGCRPHFFLETPNFGGVFSRPFRENYTPKLSWEEITLKT